MGPHLRKLICLVSALHLLTIDGEELGSNIADAAHGGGHDARSTLQWFLVPSDDLAAFEALEFAIMRINEMRQKCSGFHLAPLQFENYITTEVYLQDRDLYEIFRLHVEALHGLAPGEIVLDIARQHSVTDLSLFEVIRVHPLPCDLFSEMDDAELMVPWDSAAAQHGKNAAMEVLNTQRSILCPQRPELQFIRIATASVQPAEGKVVRLVMEMREASTSFRTSSFTEVVTVVYSLDPDVPSQCTVSPEIYPARAPCEIMYTEDEQSATELAPDRDVANDDDNDDDDDDDVGGDDFARRLSSSGQTLPELRARSSGGHRLGGPLQVERRLGSEDDLELRFVDKGLHIPSDFDPRLERTLCFPRGFSRRQGSCGSSWAFAATAVASFRECLWYLHQGQTDAGLGFFSSQELSSCNPNEGCSGGSASIAFYYMKRYGISREACSPYRMRCYIDNTVISVSAADSDTSAPRSSQFQASAGSCPLSPDLQASPCKCLPSVYHLTKPVSCKLLPNACPKVMVPHYFKIVGTAEGNTVPEIERAIMQELITAGPLYVSFLVYDDMFDPVSWTESGVYIHQRGRLIGKHAAAAVGWGTDVDGRDYWLLLNSYGSGWQQEGYFKVMRGENSLQMSKFAAWGVDWTHAHVDKSKPGIVDVEVSFSAVVANLEATSAASTLTSVWLQVAAFTDEPSQMLVRVQGLENTVTGEMKDGNFITKHVLKLDLFRIHLLGERAKIQIWAVDRSENTGTFGPFTFEIPDAETFSRPQGRRLLSRADVAV